MTGTRFRTLLAPIGISTGDGRRFQDGGITLASVPMPFEWVRSREGGHDGAVAVGVIQSAEVLTIAQAIEGGWISEEGAAGLDPNSSAVFGQGVMFDDADRETMPRLAEDVAEAMHLAANGTLGPSVDLDSFEASPVMAGSDEPLNWEMVEQYMDEHDGAEPPIELLVTTARVRAATLVTIPAFSETSRPFELLAGEDAALVAAEEEGRDTGEARARDIENTRALIASVSLLARQLPAADLFDRPTLAGPTPITWDWDAGRVYGHIATWATCHVGYAGVCVTPPREPDTYAWFNRFTVDTQDGAVAAGRLTLGGRHAGLSLSASAAMSAYDGKTTAAHVRAYADEYGIVVSGVIEPDLTGADRAILDRRKISGDWREIGGTLSLVEVLALSPGPRAHSEPGFPVVETHSRGGRQVALTASLGPDPAAYDPDKKYTAVVPLDLDAAVEAAIARREARAALARTVENDDRKAAESARQALAAVIGEE